MYRQGDPDDVEIEGEADEDGLIIEGDGDEAGMENQWVDVGTYPGIPTDNDVTAPSDSQPQEVEVASDVTVNKVSKSITVKLSQTPSIDNNKSKIVVKKNIENNQGKTVITKQEEMPKISLVNSETTQESRNKPRKVVTGSIADRVSAYLKNAQSDGAPTENGEPSIKPLVKRPQKKAVHVESTKTDTRNFNITPSVQKQAVVSTATVKLSQRGDSQVVEPVDVEERPAQPRVEEVWDEPVAQRTTLTNWNPVSFYNTSWYTV